MFRKILLADDSPTIRKIVELTFGDSEFRVETVASGREALERLEAMQPDVVLADVVMPDPSGYELCRVVKQSERPVPVLLLAGTFEPFDPGLARECGADGHLIKPFESHTLMDKVLELLAPPPDSAEEEPPTAAVDEALAEVATPEEPAGQPPAVDEPWSPEPLPSADASAEPSPALVDAVARAVILRLSDDVVREVAWEVVPKLATELIRDRIRELEEQEPDEG